MGNQIFKTLILIIIVSCFLFSTEIYFAYSTSSTNTESIHTLTSSHSPINITNDSQFSLYASSGNGSKLAPYMLENYVFSNYGNTTTAFTIANTTKYFVITNISVNKCGTGNSLTNVSNGQVRNSFFSNTTNGIYISNSSFNTFIGNQIFNNIYGIIVEDLSANNTIDNNFLVNNNQGIRINYLPTIGSIYGTYANNIANNNENGYVIDDLTGFESNMFLNNTASFNSEYGFYIFSTNSNDTFINNTAYNNIYSGFKGEFFSNVTLSGNIASNNDLQGFEFSPLIRYNTIQNNLAEYNGLNGFLFNSSNFFKSILNNTANYNQNGLSFIHCSYAQITNNSAFYNLQDGFYLNAVTYSNLTTNIAENNSWSNLDEVNSIGLNYVNNTFPVTLPSAPLDFTLRSISTPGQNQIELDWQPPIINGGAALYYNVYKSTDNSSFELIVTTFSTVYYDSNISIGSTYIYSISAVNSAGESPNATSPTLTFTIYGLASEPLHVTATLIENSLGQEQVDITWQPPATDGSGAIIEYDVYRTTGNSNSYILIGTTAYLYFNDSEVSFGLTYDYEVSAVNSIGEGSRSSSVSIFISGPSLSTNSKTQTTSGSIIALGTLLPVFVLILAIFVVVVLVFTYMSFNKYRHNTKT